MRSIIIVSADHWAFLSETSPSAEFVANWPACRDDWVLWSQVCSRFASSPTHPAPLRADPASLGGREPIGGALPAAKVQAQSSPPKRAIARAR
ncbi:MAG: hypothetical protein ACI82G_001888 [Bradymonadia bacterium]|jgi:hypothetical protein